ncbi:DNA-pol protein [Thysanoplusia orichalcea nucleopolyhedrovirus]|uniref:DNA polymerase n=1 Tax=Thysanoplusia orichalcea nucleopolyhedrovirus TaxID=101850 RepID=L0CLT8_9ABAC|nr:DNA-pol protein [Thysanoplusia orichalcea nucleopolyhedrovirus]AGA16216.1 DNA-pol protein [Thysanoplusia orichalcea nucleopolyhedrovirus]
MKIYTYNDVKSLFADYARAGNYSITSSDTFRIIRLYYNEKIGCLFVFCNANIDGRVLQFYFKVKLNLYSYKLCYDKHIFPFCRNKCTSYTTFVAPGLKGVHLNKINVVKYKRNEATASENASCLDKFLHNVNRVHMQTPFVEGAYVRFKKTQRCQNNYVGGSATRMFNLEYFDEDFEVVDEMTLTSGIMPVLSCYDIETHSDGHNMSKPSADCIMCIGFTVYKDDKFTNFCFMYHKNPTEILETDKNDNTFVVMFKNEVDMITAFFDMIKLTNPDVILNFNGDVFDMPYIIARLKNTKILLKRYDLPAAAPTTKLFINKLGNKVDTYYFDYYVHIDLYKFFSSDSNQHKVENFQLNTISSFYLGEQKIDLPWTEMVKMYNARQLGLIAQYNVQDCMLPIKLFVKLKMADSVYSQCILHCLCTDDVICNISHLISVACFHAAITNTRFNDTTGKEEPDPYFFNKNDLSTISGQFKTDNSAGGISNLKRKLIPLKDIPKNAVNLGPADQTVKYKGGKVLQPRAGIYKNAFSLDFNSLYLTIMIAICACLSNLVMCEDGNVYLNRNSCAIVVKLLIKLLRERCKFKKNRDNQSESAFLYDLYDQKQNSVKRTANSIYGYYGIFYKTLANYITKVGRNQLRLAISLIESLSNDPEILKEFNLSSISFKVIYGDTDSTFVLPTFVFYEVPEETDKLKQICTYVEKRVNNSFTDGYKMAFENLMKVLILLKKKKYCYLNSENKIVYKGWLVKKDMPVFMRIAFRKAVEQILRHLDIDKCLQTLQDSFFEYYDEFGKSKSLTDYSFSMTYNDNPGKKRKSNNDDEGPAPPKRRVITVARRCREILINKGTDFVPGNGDRIPYVLIDIEGKMTEKAYPLRLFDPAKMRISWIKIMGILCTFMNELLEIYGDEYKDKIAKCFECIMKKYMQNQLYDQKEPMLVKINSKKCGVKRKRDNDDDDDDVIEDNCDTSDSENNTQCSNNTYKFSLYKKRK